MDARSTPRAMQHCRPFQRGAYRRRAIRWQDNEALRACAKFRGDVLIVEAENDDIVPHQVTENYRAAFVGARSRTARVLSGADHALSLKTSQKDYTSVLISWLTEMIVGARGSSAKEKVERHKEVLRAQPGISPRPH